MKILIIEDDPMVAQLNEQFLKEIPTVTVVGNCRSTLEAKEIMTQTAIDLLLLDNYLPQQTGIAFLSELRQMNNHIGVILVTAANDMETIDRALILGVIDYLVKPFSSDRLHLAIKTALNRKRIMEQFNNINQENIDKLFHDQIDKKTNLTFDEESLPKGLSKLTMKKVLQHIELEPTAFSTEQLAKKIGISRISTKKYLTYLVETNTLVEHMEYQDIGRPITLYTLNQA